MDSSVPLGLVMGSEGKGLRRLTRSLCDQLVSIPMLGAVESLNVAVATGVLLFEVVRQRSRVATFCCFPRNQLALQGICRPPTMRARCCSAAVNLASPWLRKICVNPGKLSSLI